MREEHSGSLKLSAHYLYTLWFVAVRVNIPPNDDI